MTILSLGDKNSHALMEEGTIEKNLENGLSVSYKFKHTLYDQPIPLIGIYSEEMKNWVHTRIYMTKFIETLL